MGPLCLALLSRALHLPELDQERMVGLRAAWFDEAQGPPPGNKREWPAPALSEGRQQPACRRAATRLAHLKGSTQQCSYLRLPIRLPTRLPVAPAPAPPPPTTPPLPLRAVPLERDAWQRPLQATQAISERGKQLAAEELAKQQAGAMPCLPRCCGTPAAPAATPPAAAAAAPAAAAAAPWCAAGPRLGPSTTRSAHPCTTCLPASLTHSLTCPCPLGPPPASLPCLPGTQVALIRQRGCKEEFLPNLDLLPQGQVDFLFADAIR